MSDKDNAALALSVRTLRENLPALMELKQLDAKLCRVKFLALVEQGFTPEQALELCKDMR